jgi:hypothetical protein
VGSRGALFGLALEDPDRRQVGDPLGERTQLCARAAYPPPRQFRHAVPELFTDLYVFRVLGGTPVHLTWRGDLSRLKKTCFGHIAQPGGASGGTVPLDALPSVKPEGRAVPEPGFQASSAV